MVNQLYLINILIDNEFKLQIVWLEIVTITNIDILCDVRKYGE